MVAAVLVPVVIRLARRGTGDVVQSATVRADRLTVPPDPLQPPIAAVLVREHPVELRDADGVDSLPLPSLHADYYMSRV